MTPRCRAFVERLRKSGQRSLVVMASVQDLDELPPLTPELIDTIADTLATEARKALTRAMKGEIV